LFGLVDAANGVRILTLRRLICPAPDIRQTVKPRPVGERRLPTALWVWDVQGGKQSTQVVLVLRVRKESYAPFLRYLL